MPRVIARKLCTGMNGLSQCQYSHWPYGGIYPWFILAFSVSSVSSSEETEEAEEAEIEVEEKEYVEEPAKIPETPSECRHYLGYLSEKSAKEQIPDECMMCKDIVACMLKKMKE